MTKYVLILIALMLFIVGIAGWTFAIISRYTIFEKEKEITNQGLQLSTAQAKAQQMATAEAISQETVTAQIQATSIAQQATSTGQQATSAAQQAINDQATEVISTVTQSAIEQSTLVAGLRHLSATQRIEIGNLEDTSQCTSGPNSIDYTSNSTVSTSLKNWLEDTVENITNAGWEVPWAGTKTAVHKIYTENYLYIFVAYFDEPKYYFSPSVYDVFGHCWIDQ